jgi:hypothetical protein
MILLSISTILFFIKETTNFEIKEGMVSILSLIIYLFIIMINYISNVLKTGVALNKDKPITEKKEDLIINALIFTLLCLFINIITFIVS